MVKRFKTRDELRETGWTFEKRTDGNFVFTHPNSLFNISVDMLKLLNGLTEDECKTDSVYRGYEYDDNMFIEEKEIEKPTNENILKKVLSEKDYRTYLKSVVIENVYNENYEEARIKLDELCT